MKTPKYLLIAIVQLFLVQPAFAEPVRVYVAEFKVVDADPAKDEMKTTLQELLASRLAGDDVVSVETPSGADYLVSGRYTMVGNVFSIDVAAKNAAGKVAARAYEQGNSRDELIPALGKLARKLDALLAKDYAANLPKSRQDGPPKGEAVQGIVASPAGKAVSMPSSNERVAGSAWLSQRIAGTFVGIAPGRILGNGSREIYLAGNHSLQLYRQGKSLELVCEASFKSDEQIIGVDTADLDGDGNHEVYLTVYNGESLVSQVWIASDDRLKKVAEQLPYYFRAIALDGKNKKIYAQKMSRREDFFGEVYELSKAGEKFEATTPLKLPRHGFIYNFSQFSDKEGKLHFVELNEDGLLSVISRKGEELWQSKDKYGGSGVFFNREHLTDARFNGEPYRKVFLQQRIEVTPEGEIIVPQNPGSWKIGGSSGNSYVYGLAWNGSSLEKRWRSTESESHLSDFYYDRSKQDLVRLEIVKPASMFDKGASIVSIQKLK